VIIVKLCLTWLFPSNAVANRGPIRHILLVLSEAWLDREVLLHHAADVRFPVLSLCPDYPCFFGLVDIVRKGMDT
jgi:hypothetical protein